MNGDKHLDSSPSPTPGSSEPPESSTVAARWRAVAASRGDAVAVRTPEASITFAEAPSRVELLADRIVASTEPGEAVPVEIESDIDSVISMLAVWCSGRRLVLLDPFLPEDRRANILRLSGVNPPTPSTAPAPTGDEARGRTVVEPGPDDPAVLLFTSGSTGAPKGVVLPQRMPVNHARDGRRFLRLGPDDRAAVLLPLSFGGGLDALTMSLLNGATMLLWDVRRRTTTGLRDWLSATGATTAHCTPSLLRSWLGELSADDAIGSLRLLSTCGEPAHGDDVLRARRTILPRGEFCCWAGASEVGNLAFNLFPPERDVEAGAIPVGSPASDKRVRIVDEHDADVPTGVTGEVVVESAHIASGYHANPELTARRFTSLPDGRTRYRTGDLGRLDENGELSLLGRDDDAVKVRGYLVEPLEVEAALLALPWTVDAVVTANRNEGRLTAHVAVDPAKWSPSPAEIRLELGKSLTPWMIPRDIIVLSELPPNERGKVVRAELPPPPPRPAPEPPRGLTEFALHQVWCDILGLESIGRNEDFVELGGDSLAAAKMLAEVGHHLQLDVNTAMLAEAPTIARFAARIEAAAKERSKNASGATLIPLRKGTGDPIFLMAGAGSLATSLTPIVRALSGDRPVYGIQSRGVEKRGRADHSVRAAARRAITDIRSVQPRGPYQVGGYSLGGFIAVEVAARLTKAGETCHTVAVLDSVIDPALAQRLSGERPNLIQRIRSSLRSLTAAKETLPDRTGSDEDSKPGGSPLQHALQQIALKVLVLTAGLVPLSTSVQWVVFFRLGTEMIRRHRPSPYSGPITVIRARTNTDDPALWGHFTSGRVEFVDVDGDHISVIRPPHVAATARAIDQVLERTSD
ncbi:non-ribosomal peptide synthetase [Gordonia amicalis]|uniref:Non-ribosomal peptide synthetase n=1 Tax=Gordonia amicalis TaxID=89053 RepID=A0ABU4DEJ6_9ACTN|nr:non-ribosomal peptide synthetase [Gordonia amicalis]MDV6307669.1 non-ribosomal peptide synthetase [Gordonia amicalis]MDV7099430.1 non-ribosomal peptide synthetase [Gordonia amicalis]UKO92430.1 non-ribosomal peptide synthetase [Gordonia amicalis]